MNLTGGADDHPAFAAEDITLSVGGPSRLRGGGGGRA